MGSTPALPLNVRLNLAKLLISLNLHLVYEMGNNIGAYLIVLLGGFNGNACKGTAIY